MKNNYRFVKHMLFGVSVFFLVFGVSCAKTFDTLMREVEKKQAKIKTIAFNFSQEMVVKATGEKTKTEGRVIYKKPDKFLVKNIKPFSQTICTDGTKLWLYNPGAKQMIVRKYEYFMKQENFLHFFDFVFGISSWKETYRNTFLFEKKENYVVGLEEKDAEGSTIYVYLSKTDFFPRKIEIAQDEVSITTKIEKVKFNKKYVDALFVCKADKDVEIWNMEE